MLERTTQPEAGYLDLPRLAAYASLGVSTIREYIRSGGLPAFKLRGKIIVRKTDFDHWLERFKFDAEKDLDGIADEIMKDLRSDS